MREAEIDRERERERERDRESMWVVFEQQRLRMIDRLLSSHTPMTQSSVYSHPTTQGQTHSLR